MERDVTSYQIGIADRSTDLKPEDNNSSQAYGGARPKTYFRIGNEKINDDNSEKHIERKRRGSQKRQGNTDKYKYNKQAEQNNESPNYDRIGSSLHTEPKGMHDDDNQAKARTPHSSSTQPRLVSHPGSNNKVSKLEIESGGKESAYTSNVDVLYYQEHEYTVQCPRNISSYTCKEKVPANLKCGHICEPSGCDDQADMFNVCTELVIKRCSNGKHDCLVPCYTDMEDYECKSSCETLLECGHECHKVCGKTISNYRHYHDIPSMHECSEKVSAVLPCGHGTIMRCFETSKLQKPNCNKMITKTFDCGVCGHTIYEMCWFLKDKLTCGCSLETGAYTKNADGISNQEQCVNYSTNRYSGAPELMPDAPIYHKYPKYENRSPIQRTQQFGAAEHTNKTKSRYNNNREPIVNQTRIEFPESAVLDMHQMKEQNTYKILIELLNPKSGFIEMLHTETDSETDPVLETVMEKIANVCGSHSFQAQLIQLLNEFRTSLFLKTLPARLLQWFQQKKLEDCESLLLNCLVICEDLLTKMPHSYPEVVVVVSTINASGQDLKNLPLVSPKLSAVLELQSEILNKKVKVTASLSSRNNVDNEFKEPPDSFRSISIFPSRHDLKELPFLRENRTKGSYQHLGHYLDVQFRLLREDYIGPLRTGIHTYLQNKTRPPAQRTRNHDLRIYEKVKILKIVYSTEGVAYNIQFSPLQKVKWESSKRLLYGSLICISDDNFENIKFGTVIDRKPETLSKGQLVVLFDDLTNLDKSSTYILAETSAYFEAYKHVLLGLQEVETLGRFEKYLVHCLADVDAPAYLHEEQKYNLSPVLTQDETNTSNQSYPAMQTEQWPDIASTILDESQYNALKTALTKEFVLIQGPPGTGKTFLGLKISEILLKNKAWYPWYMGDNSEPEPILVVCYTNHALDQFLEGIHAFQKTGIVRVGTRSTSQVIQKFTLGELRKRKRMSEHRIQVRKEIKELEEEICNLLPTLFACDMGILNANELHPYMTENHKTQFSVDFRFSSQGHKNVLSAKFITKIKANIEIDSNSILLEWLGDEHPQLASREIKRKRKVKENDPNEDTDMKDEIDMPQYERKLDFDIGIHLNIDDIKIKEATKAKLACENNTMQKFLKQFQIMSEEEVHNIENIWTLTPNQRWGLYNTWVMTLQENANLQLSRHTEMYEDLCQERQKANLEADKEIMSQAKVIGMTTTAAARYNRVLKEIQPSVVIVEEAAEVLEAHVITTLTEGCQHLILIGDHKQLRPNPTVFELAKLYKLDISLFERMINNEIHCNTLGIQHRMRPEIAELVAGIYPQLQNHESVLTYNDIKGIAGNLYFINHTVPEACDEELRSKYNDHEAKFLVALCGYLLKQGYKSSQVTILTLYTGQVLRLKKFVKSLGLDAIRVSAVDNFQGEENDIILLSLVRSNDEGKIGFVGIENRICVSLSRAKIGFFAIGNFSHLGKHSRLWEKILASLKPQKKVVDTLPLICQNHINNSRIMAGQADDFSNAPEGGCSLKCDTRLDCGHVCTLYCHPYDHTKYKCKNPCVKLCPEGHGCNKLCWENCDHCDISMERVLPKCQHTHWLPCFMNHLEYVCPNECETVLDCGHKCSNPCGDPHVRKCPVLIEKKFPRCGHIKTMACHVKYIGICKEKCEYKFACGHPCSNACGSPHIHQSCSTMITNILKCGHETTVKCSRRDTEIKCTQLVARTCPAGHLCKVMCYEDMTQYKCKIDVRKTCNCGHFSNVHCGTDMGSYKCQHPCEAILPCGHKCHKVCGEAHTQHCRHKVTSNLPCGHTSEVTCYKIKGLGFRLQQTYLKRKSMVCKVMVTKSWACNHTANVPCHTEESKYKCPELVTKTCPRGHECTVHCSQDMKEYRCEKQILRLLTCGHTREVPCYANSVNMSHLCTENVIKRCSNGKHDCLVPCNTRMDNYDCTSVCETLLECGHKCLKLCGQKSSKYGSLHYHNMPTMNKCSVNVSVTLPCGHSAEMQCFETSKLLQLRGTQKMTNKINFGQNIYNSHGYLKESVFNCSELVTKTCPAGHECTVSCSQDMKKYRCKEKVLKMLKCGHEYEASCSVDQADMSQLCTKIVTKRCSNDKHDCQVPCNTHMVKYWCKSSCETLLDCGHKCNNVCGNKVKTYTHHHDNPKMNRCFEKVTVMLSCGHNAEMQCFETSQSSQLECVQIVSRTFNCGHEIHDMCCSIKDKLTCGYQCSERLGCGHNCKGRCKACVPNIMHTGCERNCNKTLICGHSCQSLCSEHCSPCRQPCTTQCVHQKCPDICCVPCKPCMKPCVWACVHYKCSKRCSEPCDRPRCNKACRKKLKKCGHACIGLCGEICPSKCRICDRDEVCKIYFGGETDPEARFVQLQPCGHVFEHYGLDKWMDRPAAKFGRSQTIIQRKCCPRCEVTITTNLRYGAQLNPINADISMVKSCILGDLEKIKWKAKRRLGELWWLKSERHIFRYVIQALKNQFMSQFELTLIRNHLKLVRRMLMIPDCNDMVQLLTDHHIFCAEWEFSSLTNEFTRLDIIHHLLKIMNEINEDVIKTQAELETYYRNKKRNSNKRNLESNVRALQDVSKQLGSLVPPTSDLKQMSLTEVKSLAKTLAPVIKRVPENFHVRVEDFELEMETVSLPTEEKWLKCFRGHIIYMQNGPDETTCTMCNPVEPFEPSNTRKEISEVISSDSGHTKQTTMTYTKHNDASASKDVPEQRDLYKNTPHSREKKCVPGVVFTNNNCKHIRPQTETFTEEVPHRNSPLYSSNRNKTRARGRGRGRGNVTRQTFADEAQRTETDGRQKFRGGRGRFGGRGRGQNN